MKQFWKRMLAGVLTVIIMVSLMPPAAYAAVSELVTRSAVENAALLEALRQAYGDDAEAYLAVLRQYGLLDEDGNFVTDEKIVMDGVAYTLDEIEAILDNPATNLSTVVEVDGQFLTLEELKTIVEIERYLAYVKATYFTEQDLTDEQIGSFYDLADAFASGEVMMLAANGLTGVGPAGVDHGVTLSVSAPGTAAVGGIYEVAVTASASAAAPDQPISFSWRAVSGSVDVSGGEENVTMYPGETRTLSVSVGDVKGRTQGSATFLVQICNVKNALLSDGSTRWEQIVTVEQSYEFRYRAEKKVDLPGPKSSHYYYERSLSSMDPEKTEEEAAIEAIEKTTPQSTATTSFASAGLEAGNYIITIGKLSMNVVPPNPGNYWGNSYLMAEVKRSEYLLTANGEEVLGGDVPFASNNGNYKGEFKGVGNYTTKDFPGTPETKFTLGLGFNYAHYKKGGSEPPNAKFIPEVFLRTCSVKLVATENTRTTNVEFSVPAGTYYAGQSVPITATFDYPMEMTDAMTITVNGGQPLTPVEAGMDKGFMLKTCTFLYPVDETSGGSITITDTSFVGGDKANVANGANELGMTVNLSGSSPVTVGTQAPGVSLESIDREKAFVDPQLTVTKDENNKPQLNVTVPLSSDPKYTTWVLAELAQNGNVLNSLQVMTSQTKDEKFPFRPDSEGNVTALTAAIPLPYNTGTEAIDLAADFFLDGAVWMGRGLTTQVEGSVLVAAEDMSPVLTVTPADGDAANYEPGAEVPLLYAQQDNALELSFGLADKAYTWGNPDKVTYYKEDGTLADKTAHFAWQSSDPTVAAVSVNDGGKAVVTPTGLEGEATFTLTALNGGVMAPAVSAGITVKFAAGADPFLLIPASGRTVAIREGQDAQVFWTSNICQKSETNGPGGTFAPATFFVSLYRSGGEQGEPFWTTELTTDEENRNISSAVIPWTGVLAALYKEDARTASVKVSAAFNGQTYEAEATILMTALPAAVKLDLPDGGLYQTDGGGGKDIVLTWTVPHLDTATGGKFELYIAGGGLPTPIVKTTVGEDVTQSDDTYSYTLRAPAVKADPSDPGSYRNSYTITVKAKNSAETTWAYDSYVLYVYSQNVLELLLDGAQAGDSLKMSNRERIANLWGSGGSEAIVALQRDIALKNVISINYGTYAWAELADQIAWNSSDSAVATVNYQQGTLYENIENFSYTSYRPSTDFILSGLRDGRTTVTARHVRTGIQDTLTVDVETLRDQLYLFQCYPKTKTTLIYDVYTDTERTQTEQMTLDTNDKGEAAIYAPYGIAGDVYCKSVAEEDGVTYLGTIYNGRLVSSEADSTKLQLYPVNTLRLRRAAQAAIYLKNPDGTPYANQQVTFRGGVYRQGEYCDLNNVQFGLQDEERAQWQTGDVPQIAETDGSGRLLVTMDLMQFKTSPEQKEVQAGEKLYYLFQLEHGDGTGAACCPLFLRVDASLNLDDIAATGDSIVAWEKNESNQKQPYIAQQTLKYSPSANANVADVRKSTGSVGPSATFPTAYLTTSVMWWGDEHTGDEGRVNSVKLRDATGKTPDCQTSRTITYPFTDLAFTENVMTMDDAAMKAWGIRSGENRGMQAVLSEDGQTASRTISLPFKIVNMIGVEKAEDSGALTDSLKDVKSSLKVDAGDSVKEMGAGDKMIQGGMKLLAGDSAYDPDANRDTFAVRLFATSDPTVFRALFCLSGGNMSSDDNVTGVYPEYGKTEDMAFVNGYSAAPETSDLDMMPNPMNVYNMLKGNYLDKMDAEGKQAAAGKASRSFNMDLGGYFEADIAYNSNTGSWECRPISGGFHVGGGVNFTWNFNAVVGVVPVCTSLTLGGTLEIRLDVQASRYILAYNSNSSLHEAVEKNDKAKFNEVLAAASYDEATATDYLTSLRLFLYMRVFAGVGFDYSVVAFKIGVFGQVDLDFKFRWLNRDYLNTQGYSMAGPFKTCTDDVMFGSHIAFSGSTGIEFVFKFLFISYEKILCSVGFQFGGPIEDWTAIEDIWAENKTINNRPVTRMSMPNGQVMYAVDLGAQLESRDYVDASEQMWLGGQSAITPFSLDPDQDAALAETLQSGAYSYANPVLSDDGQVMFYLSDRPADGTDAQAQDLTNTRVAVSAKSGEQFPEGTRLEGGNGVDAGCGDSAVKVAGKNGGTLTESQQMLQMNSTEIIAATSSDGNSWALHQLTSNGTPDLAPVVAASGGRIVAAWREVSSTSAAGLTSFDQQDAIRFMVYENGMWSETQTLYDGTGTAASVKGIEAAMLQDGTAAVVYTLDMDAADNSNTDWETVLTLIPSESAGRDIAEDAKSEDTVRTFRLTSDTSLDENPQITTAEFDDGTERFVVAWHTERAVTDGGEIESDIRLAAMGFDGVLCESMPESLSMATGGTGDTIGSNFRFAKNAGSIDNLSILWADTVSGGADDDSHENLADGVAAGYNNTGHDVLKAVKFVADGSSYTLSGTVEVAEMEEKNLIDHFDAYMNGEEIKSVILGTNYTKTTERTVTISDGTKDETVTITVANPVSGMYAATAEFTNRVEESAVMLEYEKLYPNSDIDVQFTIRNSGKDPVTSLSITSKDGQMTYYSTDQDPLYNGTAGQLNLLPNRDITVTAKIPTGEAIENVDYVIKVAFDGETVELPGTLYLDIPDAGVSKVETIKEANGERTLRYSLYNALSAKLADAVDRWRVQVGFYADQGCTELLKDANSQDLIRTITDKNDLALIDGGGYSAEVTLPVARYATAVDNTQEEIPGTGIPVYVKAWVEAPVNAMARTNEYDTVNEYFQGNNTTSLTLDNLAVRRDKDVTLQSTIDNSGDATSVTIDVQYNKLTGTASGNLIVTLLDANGQPLEKLQSYTQKGGLLTLSEEGSATEEFTFSQKGADVKVEFSDLILDENSVELDHVSLTGANVAYDPDTKTYTATGAGLTSGILDIAPKDPDAAITLDGAPYDANAVQSAINLTLGRKEWTIVVSNDGKSETYKLVLNNADPESGEFIPVTGVSLNKSSIELTPGETEHLTATIAPANATIRDLIWTSNDTKTATVDSNGNITAVSTGTTAITVTTADGGYTAACTVTVSAKPDEPDEPDMPDNPAGPDEPVSPGDTGGDPDISASAHSVTIEKPEHGKVTASPTSASSGSTVTLTVTPDSGYVLDTLTVADSRGNEIKLTAQGNGKYTFTMPGRAVTVKATFTPLPGDAEKPCDGGADCPSRAFTDLGSVGTWYHEAVDYALSNNLMGGYGNDLFGPNNNLTRAQLAQILYNREGKPTVTGSNPFTDAASGAWYSDAVTWAAANGLVGGYGDGRFGPNDNITREQLATILWRYSKSPAATNKELYFNDVDEISGYALDAIRWAVEHGILNGFGDGLLGPQGLATRAQVAQMLKNFIENQEGNT